MASWFMDLPVLLLLLFLMHEDFTAREVSAWIFPVLGVLWITRTIIVSGISFFITDFPLNLLLVLLFTGIIRLHARLAQKRAGDLIGEGDSWFMVLLTTVFLFPTLLLFMNLSWGAALLWWVFTRSERGIPLVGIQAACFILLLVFSWSRYLYE
ncbi:MAG: hypothetical protein LBP56_01155 [Odoribacteraceae bacterium]|jgi:hypothetical protein|nr:hypothetical protein [Odoribacteraceae bacterium]